MSNPSHEEIRRLFDQVIETPAPERAAVLDRVCAGDTDLRQRLVVMVRAAETGAFLGSPTGDLPPTGDLTPSGGTGDGRPGPPVENDGLPSEKAGELIGRYKLLERIGEGGFGSVWAAEQREPVRRRVALKIIKLGMDTRQVIARFEAERQALAMMDHPNIAKVLDAGSTETGRPFFAMELVKGVPILEYCDREKLSTKARLDLFMKVCHAIQHAHQKGIIHRDIKPGNVLVTMHDGVPMPKVIDFGIAKATNQELTEKTVYTQHHQVIGTPVYMSPEQAEMSGIDIDTRSDIYSLGVLLYELMTGTTPFDQQQLLSRGFAEMMRIIREETPNKPSTRLSTLGETGTRTAQQRQTDIKKLNLALRGDLDWIVMKCLEKDRTRRYDTANGLAADIERHLSDQPVTAGPPSAGYKLRKFVRRNRGQVVAGGAIAALLVLGVIGTSGGMVWALNEKGRANAAAESERLAKLEAQENEQHAISEAERAEAAEADASARAAELELVTHFQYEQLKSIEPEVMGAGLHRSLLDAAPEDGRDALVEALAPINFTNLALSALQDNIFERSIEAIDTKFADQPLVRARLLNTMATTVRELGLLELATDPQERALALWREHLGNDHEHTLTGISEMGVLLVMQGRYDEGEAYLRESYDRSPGVLGDDHKDTLTSIANMGSLLNSQGKYDEAEPYIREALEGRRRVLGEDHADTFQSLNGMGTLMHEMGRFEEAEEYLRQAMEGYRRVLGDNDPTTLTVLDSLGVNLKSQGKIEEAERYSREALEGRRRVLGDEHPSTLTSIGNTGGLLFAQGRHDEAELYLREAMEGRRRVLGNEHPSTLISINNMGSMLQSLGRLDEAEPFFLEATEGYRRALGTEHPDTLLSVGNLGVFFMAKGQYDKAEPYLREALEGKRRVLGPEHPHTLKSIGSMGDLKSQQGEYDEAEQYFREALEANRRVLGDEHPSTLNILARIGAMLRSQGQSAEAEPYLLEALEVSRRLLGDEHPQTVSLVVDLAIMYENLAQNDEAELYYREGLETSRNLHGDTYSETLLFVSRLGLVLQKQSKHQEAIDLLVPAEPAAREAFTGNDRKFLEPLLNALGNARVGLGYDPERFALAEANLTEAFSLRHPADAESHEITARCVRHVVNLYTAWDGTEPGQGYGERADEWRARIESEPEPAAEEDK